jgi:hypothetical protein
VGPPWHLTLNSKEKKTLLSFVTLMIRVTYYKSGKAALRPLEGHFNSFEEAALRVITIAWGPYRGGGGSGLRTGGSCSTRAGGSSTPTRVRVRCKGGPTLCVPSVL